MDTQNITCTFHPTSSGEFALHTRVHTAVPFREPEKAISLSNCVILNIEGLDVSGKETFAKSLETALRAQLESHTLNGKKIRIINHSFPTYESTYGQLIKTELAKPLPSRDRQLYTYYILDQIETMYNMFKELQEEDEFRIIILDRYFFSNMAYMTLMAADSIHKTEMREWMINAIGDHLPEPDMFVLFNRYTKESEVIHKELIANKEEKDTNETDYLQTQLASRIDSVYNHFIDIPAVKIPIGSNFGNFIYETIVLAKLYDLILVKLREDMSDTKKVGL